jgi:large subunit ribosomal protein L30
MASDGAKTAEGKMIRIRQVKSTIGTIRKHREVIRTLGLRGIRHEVVRHDTPAVRGAIAKVQYLLEIEEAV